MKSIRSSMLFKVFMLAIGVMGSSAWVSSAYAQSASGKFTLTHETRWGGVVLPPGDYTFSLQSLSLPAPIMFRKPGSVLPRTVSTEKLADDSRLVLGHDESGASFVSALNLGDIGVSLHYAPPKAQMPASKTVKLGPIADSRTGK